MSKTLVLPASCVGNVVTVEGITVSPVTILTQGVQSSTGFLIIDGENAYYVTANASDIKTTIEKINSALTEIANTLTAIGAGMTGPTTAPPGSLATSVSAINTKVSELIALKDALK